MENIQQLKEIQRVYGDYLSEIERMEKERKPTDGLLGFGRGLGSDPCHDRFSQRLEQVLESLASNAPLSQDSEAVLRYMYEMPLLHKNNKLAYWMLLAVHALTGKLIGFLSPEDAAILAARYIDMYPKSARLPSQNKVAALLQAQADIGAPRKKNLLDIFRVRNDSR